MKALLLHLLLPLAQAALPPSPPSLAPSILEISDLLSMPSENRLQIAQSRRKDLQALLEKHAFQDDVDFTERWKALVLYAQISGSEGRPVLEKGLRSKEWFMRNASLVAYQEVFPQKAAGVARQLLNDQALVVRSAAIDVLQNHMDSEVRELLWGEIDQPRNFRKKQGLWTRAQILEILAKEPVDRELPLFVNYLREADPSLHASAMSGLEKITRRQMGNPGQDSLKKRELWLAWAKRSERL